MSCARLSLRVEEMVILKNWGGRVPRRLVTVWRMAARTGAGMSKPELSEETESELTKLSIVSRLDSCRKDEGWK